MFLFDTTTDLFFCITITVLWWGAYGGLAYELQSLAKRVISLCCAVSGCERNWSDFAAVSIVVLVHLFEWLYESTLYLLNLMSCNCAFSDPYKKEEPTRTPEA